MIRVVIADDDLLVREGMERLLEGDDEIDLVAVSENREQLMEAIDREAPDVVITDIRMPPEHTTEGIDVARAIRATSPATAVIVVSSYIEPEYAIALLQGGTAGRGYLLKDHLARRDQFVSAVKEVAGGGSVIDPDVVDMLIQSRESDDSPLMRLTRREREVLSELASGKSNAAIAAALYISKRAVERHIGAIFSKLDLPDEEVASRRVVAALLYLSVSTAEKVARTSSPGGSGEPEVP
jgi:DNA-binding NarL/FixJ family response regulator